MEDIFVGVVATEWVKRPMLIVVEVSKETQQGPHRQEQAEKKEKDPLVLPMQDSIVVVETIPCTVVVVVAVVPPPPWVMEEASHDPPKDCPQIVGGCCYRGRRRRQGHTSLEERLDFFRVHQQDCDEMRPVCCDEPTSASPP